MQADTLGERKYTYSYLKCNFNETYMQLRYASMHFQKM